MARRHCTGRLLGGVALLAVSVLCNCGTSSRATAGLAFAQGLNPLASVVNLLLFQLPGLFLAAAGTLLAGVTVRYASGRLKYPIVISLVLMALFTAQKLKSARTIPDSTASAGPATPLPKSGEEVWNDGTFKRIHDPRAPEGGLAGDDWHTALFAEMTKAQQNGDQVVAMFSARGCQYCDMQLASLRKAIKTRELAKEGTAAAIFGDTLRVFVFDFEEFKPVVMRLGIEAFPTLLFMGRPGIAARMNTGYLDDEKLEMVLKEVARDKSPEDQKRKRRKGFFR